MYNVSGENMIEELKKLINNSNNIVVFTGAGISTLSGIKDFRSKDGLYNMKYKFPPELILSHSFFINETEEFYKFYKDKLNCINCLPNICHKYLKKLEDLGKLKGIITQNIDGLHSKVGCKNVLELHGTIYENYCMKCGKKYDEKIVFNNKGIPKCECGGLIKPNVVLYNEPLNDYIVDESIRLISNCDLLLVIGTSLTVYPAAGFISFFKGKNLVIINRDTTNYDNKASLVINNDIKEVFEILDK